jgi:hypothetical protein
LHHSFPIALYSRCNLKKLNCGNPDQPRHHTPQLCCQSIVNHQYKNCGHSLLLLIRILPGNPGVKPVIDQFTLDGLQTITGMVALENIAEPGNPGKGSFDQLV